MPLSLSILYFNFPSITIPMSISTLPPYPLIVLSILLSLSIFILNPLIFYFHFLFSPPHPLTSHPCPRPQVSPLAIQGCKDFFRILVTEILSTYIEQCVMQFFKFETKSRLLPQVLSTWLFENIKQLRFCYNLSFTIADWFVSRISTRKHKENQYLYFGRYWIYQARIR